MKPGDAPRGIDLIHLPWDQVAANVFLSLRAQEEGTAGVIPTYLYGYVLDEETCWRRNAQYVAERTWDGLLALIMQYEDVWHGPDSALESFRRFWHGEMRTWDLQLAWLYRNVLRKYNDGPGAKGAPGAQGGGGPP